PQQVAALPQPETIRGAGGHPAITFEADRLHWQESEGVTHVLSYAHLTELRVQASPEGGPRLLALAGGGRGGDGGSDHGGRARRRSWWVSTDGRVSHPSAAARCPCSRRSARSSRSARCGRDRSSWRWWRSPRR